MPGMGSGNHKKHGAGLFVSQTDEAAAKPVELARRAGRGAASGGAYQEIFAEMPDLSG